MIRFNQTQPVVHQVQQIAPEVKQTQTAAAIVTTAHTAQPVPVEQLLADLDRMIDAA